MTSSNALPLLHLVLAMFVGTGIGMFLSYRVRMASIALTAVLLVVAVYALTAIFPDSDAVTFWTVGIAIGAIGGFILEHADQAAKRVS